MAFGYAVIDTETTGVLTTSDRVIEVAVVGLRADGSVEGEWSTLLNPDRDLGPVHIHQISARDVLDAPHFSDVAGDLADLLQGRVIVGHNVSFDARMIEAEYRRAGFVHSSIPADACLCTMHLSSRALSTANRRLETCCAAAGIINAEAHSALGDARATAALLQRLAPAFGGFDGLWSKYDLSMCAAALRLPPLQHSGCRCVHRGEPGSRDVPFLARMAERLPQVPGPKQHQEYLSLLDRALIDRVLSAREADELVRLAAELSIDRRTAAGLNQEYLSGLARVALADAQVTQAEFDDLTAVAEMLGFGGTVVRPTLDAVWAQMQLGAASFAAPLAEAAANVSFHLKKGDMVVFTGEMSRPRDELESLAANAGLVSHPSVTKAVTIVVAGDPDSLSAKARKAAEYGIPIITEQAFIRLMAEVVGA